jgi:hypothetical protein
MAAWIPRSLKGTTVLPIKLPNKKTALCKAVFFITRNLI